MSEALIAVVTIVGVMFAMISPVIVWLGFKEVKNWLEKRRRERL